MYNSNVPDKLVIYCVLEILFPRVEWNVVVVGSGFVPFLRWVLLRKSYLNPLGLINTVQLS